MKLIGVMGQPGSGKTTFSDFFDNKKNVGIIHVDDLFNEKKKKLFRISLIKDKSNKNSEESKIFINSNMKKILYKNKLTFRFIMAYRSKLLERDLNNRIEEFEQEGKDFVLIDDWALSTHKKLFSKLDKVYGLKRKFIERRKGLKERDNLTLKQIKICDLPYSLGFLKLPDTSKTVIIKNDGSLQELQNIVEKEYKKLNSNPFDERYIVEKIPTIDSIAYRNIKKIRTINKNANNKEEIND